MSLNYLDNRFLREKGTFVFTPQEVKATQVIYFHDLQRKTFRPFQKGVSTYFPWKVYFVPALLSTLGFVLIFMTFVAPATVLLAPANAASSVNNYPPQVSDIQTSTLASQVETQEDVKVTNAPIAQADIINTSNANLPANLSSARSWPIRGTITTYYSYYHPGIDIANSYGTPIVPFMEGVVTSVNHLRGGFGNYVTIRHNGFETLYGHMSLISVVPGQVVNLGTVIGKVGSSGWSTGPHLHFEVSRNGVSVNPLSVLP